MMNADHFFSISNYWIFLFLQHFFISKTECLFKIILMRPIFCFAVCAIFYFKLLLLLKLNGFIAEFSSFR